MKTKLLVTTTCETNDDGKRCGLECPHLSATLQHCRLFDVPVSLTRRNRKTACLRAEVAAKNGGKP